jgi:hypothetical protein
MKTLSIAGNLFMVKFRKRGILQTYDMTKMGFSSIEGRLSPSKPENRGLILPLSEQFEAWHKANRVMSWGIKEEEFGIIPPPPSLDEDDRHRGFIGAALFYGFGRSVSGKADALVSGKKAWEYALKRRKGKIWQCEYVHLNEPDYMDYIRPRPRAADRPSGFYVAKVQLGGRYQNLSVSQLRKRFCRETGFGPEGFQLLAITHPHLLDMMNQRKIPFMALADYDVAPYGYEDFYDAPQLFCTNGILGLGIGNIDCNYPLFGIPTLGLPTQGTWP